MNNNQLAVLVIGVIILGGAALLFYGKSGDTATPSTTTTTVSPAPAGGDSNTPPPTTKTVTTPGTGTVTTGKASAPTVTTSVTVAVSKSTAAVAGTITPNGSPTTYWYEYGTSDTFGLRTSNQYIGSGYVSTAAPATLEVLAPNTKYFFRLSATNAYGTVTGQVFSFTTNANPITQGTIPTVHSSPATLIARTSATIGGVISPNDSQISYWFEYGATKDMGNTTGIRTETNRTADTAVSAQLNGLKPFTRYYYRLNAQNQYGTVNSGVATFTTSGSATP